MQQEQQLGRETDQEQVQGLEEQQLPEQVQLGEQASEPSPELHEDLHEEQRTVEVEEQEEQRLSPPLRPQSPGAAFRAAAYYQKSPTLVSSTEGALQPSAGQRVPQRQRSGYVRITFKAMTIFEND